MEATQTPLVEIRTFLTRHRAPVAPWTSAEGTVEALYATLQTHRDDSEFWLALKKLSIRLEGHMISPSAAVNCDVLRHATVSQLLDDLQRELQQKKPTGGVQMWIRTPIVVTALAGFLFLGCVASDDDGTTNGSGITALTDDELNTCDEDGVETGDCADYVELLEVVKEAEIWEGTLDDLLTCLPNLDAAFRREMLDAFDNFNDDEIASYLANLTDSGQVCFDDDDIGGH